MNCFKKPSWGSRSISRAAKSRACFFRDSSFGGLYGAAANCNNGGAREDVVGGIIELKIGILDEVNVCAFAVFAVSIDPGS